MVAVPEAESTSSEVIGGSHAHDSAHLHVTGRALYCDDIPLPANALHGAFGRLLTFTLGPRPAT